MLTNPPCPGTTNPPNLLAMVIKYDNLLQRYARRLVHNDTLASLIVLEAFQSYYERLPSSTGIELRKGLQAETLMLCKYWLKHNDVSLFLAPRPTQSV